MAKKPNIPDKEFLRKLPAELIAFRRDFVDTRRKEARDFQSIAQAIIDELSERNGGELRASEALSIRRAAFLSVVMNKLESRYMAMTDEERDKWSAKEYSQLARECTAILQRLGVLEWGASDRKTKAKNKTDSHTAALLEGGA